MTRPLTFYTVVICVATLLAYGGRWSWACELLVTFRTHFAGLLGLSLVLAIAIRRWPIAGIAAAGLVLNLWPMHRAFFGPGTPSAPPPDAHAVRVVAFNVNISNDDLPRIAAYLDSLNADVVVVEELSPPSADLLETLLPRLPNRYSGGREGLWDVSIFSRWPLISPEGLSREGHPLAVRVDVDLGDRKLRVYGAHLHWPVIPAAARVRNFQLGALGRELSECPHACVAVGDFNVTPWSSHFRDVLEMPGIRDCAAGRGLLSTWTSMLPAPLRIRIDQCLAAGGVSVADVRVGESVTSDHFATINDLWVSRP